MLRKGAPGVLAGCWESLGVLPRELVQRPASTGTAGGERRSLSPRDQALKMSTKLRASHGEGQQHRQQQRATAAGALGSHQGGAGVEGPLAGDTGVGTPGPGARPCHPGVRGHSRGLPPQKASVFLG